MDKMISMKFIAPDTPKDEMKREFDDLHQCISKAFNELGTQSLRV